MFPPQRGSDRLWARIPGHPDPCCTPSGELQFLLAASSCETRGPCKQAPAWSGRMEGGFGFFPATIHLRFLSQTSPSFKTSEGNFLPAPCHGHKSPFSILRTSSTVSVSSSRAPRDFRRDGNKDINEKFDYFFFLKPRPFIFIIFLHGISTPSLSQSCHTDGTALVQLTQTSNSPVNQPKKSTNTCKIPRWAERLTAGLSKDSTTEQQVHFHLTSL